MAKAAYIHIPFCRRRCYYCDFPVSVIGNHLRGETSNSIADYVRILCQEIGIQSSQNQALETIFFGGGTPSLLSVEQLEKILLTLNNCWGIISDPEISMEIDPGTFDFAHLQGYAKAGVNRVSLGGQTFQDQLLKSCGRSHSVEDIFTAVDLIHQVGIANFSLDLISGLPNQTLDQWQKSLEQAVSLNPKHLSCYDLVLEPVTVFGKKYEPGTFPLPTDEKTAQMYRFASYFLAESGYQHYEISNYAQPRYQCRHNRVYWENQPYYGFGMGAASYINGQRFTRPRTRKGYYQWVQKLQANHGRIESPVTSKEDELLESLMLGLRLAEGIDLKEINRQFGKDVVGQIKSCLQPYLQKGWVEIEPGENCDSFPQKGRLRLTDPDGFLFSNTVLADLFHHLADCFEEDEHESSLSI